ncbi:MAG: thiamine phosphate synthase [Nitrospiraceae bacterium]|nr:MAG: thiamine phosphate synthase [Nitrospiraceae bacterium]
MDRPARIRKIIRWKTPLYLITDTAIAGLSHRTIARRAIAAGIGTIQIRDKCLCRRELYREAAAVRKITREHGVTLIINDHVDIALAVDADGVHLGQEDLPLAEARSIMGDRKIIGLSTHSASQAARAEQGGADYIGFGPLYRTETKDAGRPRGIRALQEVRRIVTIPVVAIGGISRANIREVLDAGADAAAILSAVLSGGISRNIKSLLSELQ